MKVIIIMPLAEQKGGAELMLLQLMQKGINKGIDWFVIFLEKGSMVEQVRSLGIKTKVINAGRLRNFFKLISTIIKIKHIAKKEKADLIFSWMGKAHLYGGLAGILSGISSVWYNLGISNKKGVMDIIPTLIPSKLILTCSKLGSKTQSKIWPKRNIKVVYPAVELERFDNSKLLTPSKIRKKLNLPDKSPVIGIIGRLQKWKGIHVLIKSMPHILKKYPEACCVIIGGKHNLEQAYPRYLKKIIDELKLKNKVILAGFQKNIHEWTQALDIVVHASDNEPFGIVILEAMDLGKPVVAGDKGGPKEIITEEVNGLFAPYGNAKILANQILRYLDDPKFAKKIGEAAQKRARDFSLNNYVNNIIEALK